MSGIEGIDSCAGDYGYIELPAETQVHEEKPAFIEQSSHSHGTLQPFAEEAIEQYRAWIIQEQAKCGLLEAEANRVLSHRDAEEDREPVWFRHICYQAIGIYDEAIRIASGIDDTALVMHFMEKKAEVYDELDHSTYSDYILADACALGREQGIEHRELIEKLQERLEHKLEKFNADPTWLEMYEFVQKLYLLSELHSHRYRGEVQFACDAIGVSSKWIKASLTHPVVKDDEIYALLEAAALEEDADMYEQAGQAAMLRYEEGLFVGTHSHPLLVAALCFEKSPRTEKLATELFKKIAEEAVQSDFTLAPLEEDLDDETLLFYTWGNCIYAAPAFLEHTLACLKAENHAAFADLICKQIEMHQLFFTSLPSFEMDESKEVTCVLNYLPALLSVSRTVLGNDSLEFERIQAVYNQHSLPEDYLSKKEAEIEQIVIALLSIYQHSSYTFVKKILDEMESNEELLCP